MGFPRQEYWIGLPFPPPGNLLDPGIEPTSPSWKADSLLLSQLGSPKLLYTGWINNKLLLYCAVVFSRSAMSNSLQPRGLQLPGSSEFSGQEYWSALSFPPRKNLPNPGFKPMSLASPALAAGFFTASTTWEALLYIARGTILNILWQIIMANNMRKKICLCV